jgi:hypothetical protein
MGYREPQGTWDHLDKPTAEACRLGASGWRAGSFSQVLYLNLWSLSQVFCLHLWSWQICMVLSRGLGSKCLPFTVRAQSPGTPVHTSCVR